MLPPGASKVIDIMANLGASNFGTVKTTLSVQGLGSSSNVTVYENGDATFGATPVTGQTITMANGKISNPTIVSADSTQAQYVSASSGLANGTTVKYKFTATNGAGTINTLHFLTPGPITGVSVNGQSCLASLGSCNIVGVNLAVPNTTTGVEVPAYVSYGSVSSVGGIALSGATSTIALKQIQYTMGSGAQTTVGNDSTIIAGTSASPVMYMVGAKPTLVVTSTNAALNGNGSEDHLMDVAVTPVGGTIGIQDLLFSMSSSQTTGSSTLSSVRLADTSGTTIAEFACTSYDTVAHAQAGSTGTSTLLSANLTVRCHDTSLAGNYQLSSAKTLSLYGTVTFASYGAANTSSVSTNLTSLSSASGSSGLSSALSPFSWIDISGGAAAAQTAGQDYTNFYSYPTQTWSVHN